MQLFPKIATVGVPSMTFISCLLQTVVGPLPDPSALQERLIVKHIDVLLQSARTVAH
jgi:hypothetical protein